MNFLTIPNYQAIELEDGTIGILVPVAFIEDENEFLYHGITEENYEQNTGRERWI